MATSAVRSACFDQFVSVCVSLDFFLWDRFIVCVKIWQMARAMFLFVHLSMLEPFFLVFFSKISSFCDFQTYVTKMQIWRLEGRFNFWIAVHMALEKNISYGTSALLFAICRHLIVDEMINIEFKGNQGNERYSLFLGIFVVES